MPKKLCFSVNGPNLKHVGVDVGCYQDWGLTYSGKEGK